MEERRYNRKNLLYYLQVKDTKTGRQVGRAIDISRGGIRLCTSDPITKATRFDFSLDLPKSWYNDKPLNFKAKSLWCRQDVNPDLYVSGFSFEDISLTGLAKIERLLSAASFPDSFEANEGVELRTANAESIIQSIENHVDRAEEILQTATKAKPKTKKTRAKTAKPTRTKKTKK